LYSNVSKKQLDILYFILHFDLEANLGIHD
jgi:hypothetical protein